MTTPTARDWTVACVCLALWWAFAMARNFNSWSVDMSALYLAARFADAGLPELIFGGPEDAFWRQIPPEWDEALRALGADGQSAVHYVYPPIWAYLLGPAASALDPISFQNIARGIVIGCLTASILLAWRLMRPRMSLPVFTVVSLILIETTVPAMAAIGMNQPQVAVVFLILLAFERYASGRETTAGIALGLAAALKVSPVLLCLIFVADKRWRAASVTLATAGGTAILSFVVAGADLHWVFLTRVAEIEALVPFMGMNLTFETLLHDLLIPVPPCATCMNPLFGFNTPWISNLSKVLLAAAFFLAIWLPRRLPFENRLCLRLLLGYSVLVFFSPLAWIHYYVLPVLLLPGLFGILPPRVFAPIALIVWAGFSHPVMFNISGATGRRLTLEGMDPQHIGLLSLLAIAAATVIAIRRNAPDGPVEASSRRLPA